MTPTTRYACFALAAACLLAGAAAAEKTRFWRQSSFEDFEKGTAKGVSLRSDGKLALAPRFAEVADPNTAYLWGLRTDSKGNAYVAGGSNAKVVRVDAKGAATTVFESSELAAQAVALDKQGNLYVATSPDGKVYKVPAKGEKSVFFDPKTKYIWDLAFDAAGTLYVATGDKGEIYSVKADGKGELFYKSEETHIRVLAFDGKGNLVAGTDPSGVVLRVEKTATAQQGFVIYETARKEVTALVADKTGNLYAAAIGEKPRVSVASAAAQAAQQQAAAAVAAAAAAAAQAGQPVPAPQPTPFAPFPASPGGSEVYKIGADGAPEVLWTSREDLVYALGLTAAGKILLGTGNRGQIVQLEGNRVFSTLAKTASSQVTGLALGVDGRVMVATANPGKVFALGPDFEPEGTYESQAFDARIFSQWGRLSWWGENGATHGHITFFARSGNTSNPEKNWSGWGGPYADAQGALITAPAARFVQWKAVFRPPAGKAEPEALNVAWVSVAYLPKNVAPVVDHVIPQSPGVRVQGFPAQSGGAAQPVQLRLPPPPGGSPAGAGPASSPARFDAPPQGFALRGAQGVVWSARDENEDELTYNLYFRGEGEKEWKLLKESLQQRFYSWDAGTMPDGAYYLRVVASDAPSNPPGEELTAERESDRFEVDNTPPALVNVRAEPQSPAVRVSFDARDSFSPIARVEYSLDAGEWRLVFPADRTTDATSESYQFTLNGLAAGEHTIAVRAFDQFDNMASSKVTFRVVPPQKK
jgi:hypothetical protein